jgi:glycerate dehydrogenase
MNATPVIVALDGATLNPGDNPWDEVAALGDLTVFPRTAPGDLAARASAADILLTNKAPLAADLLAALPRLKFIAVTATGFNVVDAAAARRQGIPVSNVPVYGTDSVAQYVIAAILHTIHDPGRHDAAIRAGEWQRRSDFSFWLTPLRELAGKTLGVVGLGRIGRRTAELAHAFGMRVIAHNPRPAAAPAWPGFCWVGLEELFRESDFISLHCPQTSDNLRFVNRRLLELAKPELLLVNAARGTLVNESDLSEALNSGRIGGAVLDVLGVEPPLADNPLLSARNCVLTPHLAWAALEARRRLMAGTAANIAAFLAGQPVNVVN